MKREKTTILKDLYASLEELTEEKQKIEFQIKYLSHFSPSNFFRDTRLRKEEKRNYYQKELEHIMIQINDMKTVMYHHRSIGATEFLKLVCGILTCVEKEPYVYQYIEVSKYNEIEQMHKILKEGFCFQDLKERYYNISSLHNPESVNIPIEQSYPIYQVETFKPIEYFEGKYQYLNSYLITYLEYQINHPEYKGDRLLEHYLCDCVDTMEQPKILEKVLSK